MTGKTTRVVKDDGAAVFAGARKRLDDCPTVPGTVRVRYRGDCRGLRARSLAGEHALTIQSSGTVA